MKSNFFPTIALLGSSFNQKALNLSGKAIDFHGIDFAIFKNAESLNLSNCQLTELPKGIENMPRLKSLKLSNNHQLSIAQTLLRLADSKSLRSLDISSNRLRQLPAEIYHLRSLKKLVIDDNPVDAMSAFNLLNLPESIEELSFYGCVVNEISPRIKDLPCLKELHLDHDVYDDLVRINLYNPKVQLMVA